MTIAYLVNQYPHVSHTFIRREIAALEELGLVIERFSIRPAPADLVDPADRAEVGKTRVILAAGAVRLAAAMFWVFVHGPMAFLRAFACTWRMSRRSDRGLFVHLVYLAEAAWLKLALKNATHLHAHFGTNSATVALLCRLLGGPPYSFTVHGPEEFDKPEGLALGLKIRHSRFAVAISEFGRSQLCRWAEVADWSKLIVVRCGLDDAFLAGEPSQVPDVTRFVCVGRLSEQKGQFVLLEAAARLRECIPGLQIILAGDGPLRRPLETRIRELHLGMIVTITGWLSNDEVRDAIRGARVLVLPSFAEGLPVVLMEALALGRPVVTTYVAGIPELVTPACGWLVPAGSVDCAIEALTSASATPVESLSQMGAAGCAAVRQMHDVRIEAKKLAERFGQRVG